MLRALCILIVMFAAANVFGERRALVIGNTLYDDPDLKLDAPHNDADEIGKKLEKLGFKVTSTGDLKLTTLTETIDTFTASVKPGDLAVFYYAGHAIQLNGQNYLWPTDTRLPKLKDAADKFVPIGRLFSGLKTAGVGTAVVILDACRNNPYYSALSGDPDWVPGLALPTGAPTSSFIAYATAPGKPADDSEQSSQPLKHSPFTRALLGSMSKTGASIEDVFHEVAEEVKTMTEGRQTPWIGSSLAGDFYFHPPVAIRATIHGADDDCLLVLDGEEVLSWNNSPNREKQIPLHGGDNELMVKVYNQKSFTPGIEGLFNGHLPEGWNYHISVLQADGTRIAEIQDSEDEPKKDGPHQGHLFDVARIVIHVDDDTGTVTSVVTPRIW